MKKIIIIAALVFITSASFAQLTLTEKTSLSENTLFRARIFQALFSKANYYVGLGAPANLKAQKQQVYAKKFVVGGSASIDIFAASRYWLSNYNGAQILDSNGQPIDSEILESAGLDKVFDSLAGVIAGDESLPVQ